MTTCIERWYKRRGEGGRRRYSIDCSDEKTELDPETGIKRTITRFPDSTFLSYDEMFEIINSSPKHL